jgi:hypothetical protein
VDECKPLPSTRGGASPSTMSPASVLPCIRGLHSSTIQLNLSALYGLGGARRGCVARVKVVLGGVQGVYGVFL